MMTHSYLVNIEVLFTSNQTPNSHILAETGNFGQFLQLAQVSMENIQPSKEISVIFWIGFRIFLTVEFQKNILTWGTLQCAGNLSFKLLVCLATDNLEVGRVYQSFKGSWCWSPASSQSCSRFSNLRGLIVQVILF